MKYNTKNKPNENFVKRLIESQKADAKAVSKAGKS